MQKAEFQIIFRLLQNKKTANMNYRQIAAESGTSLGSVHSTMQSLMEKGYIIDNNGTRVLRKRNAIVEKWVMAYTGGLKDRYFLTRFTFLAASVKANWQAIELPDNISWGGEPAAALKDNYLQPERWDVYTADNANALIATGRMIPKQDGEIYVYKKFWTEEETPMLVIYADLLATEDDRCREAAERIKPLI